MPLLNNQLGGIDNSSNIGTDLAKLAQMPPGWVEIDGYKEHFLRDDTAAVRYFRGPWRGRQAFYEWCLGFSDVVVLPNNQQQAFDEGGRIVLGRGGIGGAGLLGGGGGAIQVNPANQTPFLTRVPPAGHPEFTWLFAVGCELVRGDGAIRNNPTVFAQNPDGTRFLDPAGLPVPVPMIEYFDNGRPGTDTALSAVVAVSYRNLEFEVRRDSDLAKTPTQTELERNVVRRIDSSAGFLPLPSGIIKFYEGPPGVKGNDIPQNANNIISFTSELLYGWIDVPDPPWVAISECVGKVNSVNFDGARGWPVYFPGTLLCESPKVERHRSPLGRISWDCWFRFLYRSAGWNKLPASKADGTEKGYYGVSYGGNPNNPGIYDATDLSQLFVPPPPVIYQ